MGKSAGSFDEGVGETDDALAVLADAQSTLGAALPVVLAGFSFGAYVQTRVAQRIAFQRLVLVGPAVGRFAVGPVPADTIVIHGEEDEVVPLADVFAWARPQELPIVVFPGCGHFFHGRLPQLQRVVTGMWQAAGLTQDDPMLIVKTVHIVFMVRGSRDSSTCRGCSSITRWPPTRSASSASR